MLGPGQADYGPRAHSVISTGVFVFHPTQGAASEEWVAVGPRWSFMALSTASPRGSWKVPFSKRFKEKETVSVNCDKGEMASLCIPGLRWV